MGNVSAKIWLNGALHDANTPVFSAIDRGASLGDGLFETIKIENGRPRFLAAHWARLGASADVLQLTMPFSADAIEQALCQLAAAEAVDSGAARLTLSRGEGPRGVAIPKTAKPNLLLCVNAGLPQFAQAPILGLSALRRNPQAITDRHKTLSYIDNIAARLQQLSQHPREEVAMLDVNGQMASASVANVFWWDGATLHTPSIHCGILPGTMRARVLSMVEQLGLAFKVGEYAPADFLCAKAAFMTNALIGMQPLAGADFGDGGQAKFDEFPPPLQALVRALRDQ